MYEARSLAVRKSPSMPMLEVKVSTADSTTWSPEVGKCRKGQRRVKLVVTLCAGVLLCCIAVFVLLTASDPAKSSGQPRMVIPKRALHRHYALMAEGDRKKREEEEEEEEVPPALEGMGMLFRRGTRAMPDVAVAHLAESTTAEDLRVFLRALHRSGMPAHTDVVLLFPFRPVGGRFVDVIRKEEEYFQSLLRRKAGGGGARRKPLSLPDGRVHSPKLSPFNAAAYLHAPEFAQSPSLWAKRRGNSSEGEEEVVHYGAVVGFDVQELDSHDELSGFLDAPPMELRRWICYPMLLGMVRNRYRHVLLTEATGVVILKDVLAPLKKKDANLHLYYTGKRWAQAAMEALYGKIFLEEEDKRRKVISTGIIIGAVRPVRSVASTMATEIVRVAVLRKSRESFRDTDALLSYLVHKNSVLGHKVASHLQVHDSSAMSSVNLLPGATPRSDDLFRKTNNRFALIQGLYNEGTSESRRNKVLDSLKKDICRSQNDIDIYSDCYSLPEAVIDMMIQ